MVPENVANVKSQAADFKPLPQGVYEAQVIDITFKPKEDAKPSKYEAKDKFWILLGILNAGENRGRALTHFVTSSFNAGFSGGKSSKLYDFAVAVMGQHLDDKAGIDVNTLVGGTLQIVVKHTQVGDKTYANIVEVMEMTKGKAVDRFTEEELARLTANKEEKFDPSQLDNVDLGVSPISK
jgi:hypothetical protein